MATPSRGCAKIPAVSTLEKPTTPFPVFMAAMVGYALAAGLLGGGLVAGGLLVLGATLLTSRGNNLGRLILGILALVTIAVGLYYAFTGPTYAIAPSLITAGVAAGTAALLFVPQSAKAYFAD
jgi:hypothetical protein